MKPINAKITKIDPEGVWASWPTKEKPEDYFFGREQPEEEEYEEYCKAYESSFVTKKVENIDRVSEDSEYWIIFPTDSNMSYEYPLKINQSCQVIETKTGVKIIKIDSNETLQR